MKVVVCNGFKMNYDSSLDYSVLGDEVTVYDDTLEEDIIDRIQGADVVVTKEMPVGADTIRKFPKCVKLIAEAGTGYNNIDIAAARERGIAVCNVPSYSSERVAATAMMLILNLSSTMQTQIGMLKKGDRSNFTQYLKVPHIEVNGKTLGVIGAGHIGNAVIKAALGLDMKILAYTRTPRQDTEYVKYVPLETLLKESDFVSLHCPLTKDTYHIINEETLAKMKPTAFLINTSRGALVDEKAVIKALKSNVIAGAGLDVLETEPPAEDNELFSLENVILTPHMGWKGLETRQRLLSILKDNIDGFMSGNPKNIVNNS
ncbi:MAG: NAD(P)-dependent oxidoreductase [Oscillospiraceae bacterium]|nr:NAD(P)-dependent oxidoreductase [Oscillospiraceae bacterium]